MYAACGKRLWDQPFLVSCAPPSWLPKAELHTQPGMRGGRETNEGPCPTYPLLMSPVGRTSGLSPGQGHKGMSGNPYDTDHLAGPLGHSPGTSKPSLKARCPPNMCLPHGGRGTIWSLWCVKRAWKLVLIWTLS